MEKAKLEVMKEADHTPETTQIQEKVMAPITRTRYIAKVVVNGNISEMLDCPANSANVIAKIIAPYIAKGIIPQITFEEVLYTMPAEFFYTNAVREVKKAKQEKSA